MAKLKLTLYDIVYYEEKTSVKEVTRPISVSTDKDVATICLAPDPVSTEKWLYQISMVDFSFQKKMYQPTILSVELMIGMAEDKSSYPNGGQTTTVEWTPLAKSMVVTLFEKKRVSLASLVSEEKDFDIGNDFYVQDVLVHYKPATMFVTLKIYSPDNQMKLHTGSRVFVSKKLGAEILPTIQEEFPLPYDVKKIVCNPDNMKVLKYNQTEHIFPYLVQYNETIYDMLARTANRWGEFMFYEDGKLNFGYDSTLKPTPISGWADLDYFELESGLKSDNTDKTYDAEAAYHTNIIENYLQKDPTVIKNLVGCGPKDGLDMWIMKTMASALGNTKSIPTWIGNQVFGDLYDLALAGKNKDTVDSEFNDKYFKDTNGNERYGIHEFQDVGKKDAFSPYTEIHTPFNEDKYRHILGKEVTAPQNAIRINYDTTCPKLKLGQIITVNGEEFIVLGINARIETTTTYDIDEGKVGEVTKSKLVEVTKSKLVFDVVAGGKDKDDNMFYPPMLSTGHIRTTGPQIGKVFDTDDPLNQNRVRIHFAWQKIDSDDEAEAEKVASPWLVYATSSASKQNGIFGKHYKGDDVIVNFANGNVENPYIVGGLAMKGNKVPGSLVERDIVLSSPGGHALRIEDGSGAGLTAFLAGIVNPSYEILTTFLPPTNGYDFTTDADRLKAPIDENISKAFEGGFQLTDKYGIYSISGSTDGRNVTVKSPWGDVAISAFTGISISAPNGEVEIKGKNIKIEAGNNLELISGTNVEYKLAEKKDTKKGDLATFLLDVGAAVLNKLKETVQPLDLSVIRAAVEVVMRPVEGALTVKSNRFLKLEAGKDECEYPVSAYKDEATFNKIKEEQVKNDLRPGLRLTAGICELIDKVGTVATGINKKYIDRYNKCQALLNNNQMGLNALIAKNRRWINGNDRTAAYLKTYEQLKDKFWADGEGLLTEADLDFKESLYSITDPPTETKVDLNARNAYLGSSEGRRATAGVTVTMPLVLNGVFRVRKQARAAILAKANELRKAIIALKKFEALDKMDVVDQLGRFKKTVPQGYRDAIGKAFNKEKLGDTFYYQPVTDEKKKLENEYGDNALEAELTVLKRKASILMLENMGFKDEWRQKVNNAAQGQPADWQLVKRPFTTAELLVDVDWNNYADSIITVPPLKADQFSLLKAALDVGKDMIDWENIAGMKDIFTGECYSYGEAKNGAILFTNDGGTYMLKKAIDEVEGPSKEKLDSTDDVALDVSNFLKDLRDKLKGI